MAHRVGLALVLVLQLQGVGLMKEATSRIKINKLLESAGWRFFADSNGPASVCLELNVMFKENEPKALGENFEKTGKPLGDQAGSVSLNQVF
jgi:hypothetical protein